MVQEPQESHRPQASQARAIILRFLLGAAPALVGVLLPIAHIRRPLVAPPHQGVLLAGCLGLVCLSLAIGLYFALERVARRVCEHFDERHNELAAKMEALQKQVAALAEGGSKRHRLIASGLAKTRRTQRTAGSNLKDLGESVESLQRHVLAIGDAFVQHGLPVKEEQLGSRLN